MKVFGIPEIKGENTDAIVIQVAKDKLGIDLHIDDIDRCHRVGAIQRTEATSGVSQSTSVSAEGRPRQASSQSTSSTPTSWAAVATEATRKNARHRPIIVKFST